MGKRTSHEAGRRRSNEHVSGIPEGESGKNRRKMTFKGFGKQNRSQVEIKANPCLDTHTTLRTKIILKAAREKSQTTYSRMKESQQTSQQEKSISEAESSTNEALKEENSLHRIGSLVKLSFKSAGDSHHLTLQFHS